MSSTRSLTAAWAVHLYTAMGLPIAVFSFLALERADASTFFLLACLSTFVDATDGFFARRAKVWEVLPGFNGRKLDDIIDYTHFTLLPILGTLAFGMVDREQAWVLSIPLIASAYGFCQERAKTDDAFVGFPSYWNIAVLYLYVLDSPPALTIGILLFLSIMVFVPIHYIYPSKAKFLMGPTLVGGAIWGAAVVWISSAPDAPASETIAWWSLSYVVYYFVASLVHHRRIHAAA